MLQEIGKWVGASGKVVAALAGGVLAGGAGAEEGDWGDFFERDFPFHASVLDARAAREGNLTPRGIILHVGAGYHVCFDPDLLRLAAVWREDERGEFLTRVGMAPGSYPRSGAGNKAPGGQRTLPEPVGEVIQANGLYPGWAKEGEVEAWEDPRVRSEDPEEPGLGPMSTPGYRFRGLRLRKGGPVEILYEAGGAAVTESFAVEDRGAGGWELVRRIQAEGKVGSLSYVAEPGRLEKMAVPGESKTVLARWDEAARPKTGAGPGWEMAVEAEGGETRLRGPYEIVGLTVPVENPWKRHIRVSGLAFREDGLGVVTSFDGDVWLVEGLEGEKQRWRRYASGLNEPMGVLVVGGEIFVFDRTAIWRLQDEDGDGVADLYENFFHEVAQTAETREFPTGFEKKPGGGFILAKGGQVGTTRGHYNGTVIEVAADGRSFEVLARGLRQPFIGVDPVTGEITASDQQGNWVPATPIHRIRKGGHYGFVAETLGNQPHPGPVEEPMVWIPHFVNQSGASQVTNYDARFGPLAGKLLHLGYNRPEILCVYPDGEQGAVASLWEAFDGGLLKGPVNPKDGQLYACGFKIWGTVGERWTSLYRVRHTGEGILTAPAEVRSERRGILMRFHHPVEELIAGQLVFYEVERWNYLRSNQYGSGNYRLDGTPGQETLPVSSVYLSLDRRAVFLGVPGMAPVQQMRLTYRLPFPSASPFPEVRAVYLTVKALRDIDLEAEGFGRLEVDLTPPVERAGAEAPVASAEEGERLSMAFGCVACHSLDGTQAEKVGPTWLGLYGSKRQFTDGTEVKVADELYLRESILNPAQRVTVAFDGEGVGMPPYLGVLKEHQVESIILFIKTLSGGRK